MNVINDVLFIWRYSQGSRPVCERLFDFAKSRKYEFSHYDIKISIK